MSAKKTPVVKSKPKARLKVTATGTKSTTTGKLGSSPLDKLPSTFANWTDQKSMIIASLDLHVFSLDQHSDSLMKKLTAIAEEEIAKVVLLLRKRIRAKSKKMDLGCRVM